MDPLWVIKFENNKPVIDLHPASNERSTAKDTSHANEKRDSLDPPQFDPLLAKALDDGTFAKKFIDQLQDIFVKMVKESGVDMETLLADADKIIEENELRKNLDDISKNLDQFDEIMKAFQKFLKNPDDLSGKDPS